MQDAEILRFLGAARQRLTSAEVLYRHQMYLDAMYLAGYAAECSLKAVLLTRVPLRQRRQFRLWHFRGAGAHDFESLKALLKRRNVTLPLAVNRAIRAFARWSPELRYEVRRKSAKEAENFVHAANDLLQWAERCC